MALIHSLSSVAPVIACQLPRTAPIVLNHVRNTMSYNNAVSPTVQKRTFLVGTLIKFSIDATVLTTAAAGMRRATGIDVHEFASRINNPVWRNYAYRYLDFGELCADKVMELFFKFRSRAEMESHYSPHANSGHFYGDNTSRSNYTNYTNYNNPNNRSREH